MLLCSVIVISRLAKRVSLPNQQIEQKFITVGNILQKKRLHNGSEQLTNMMMRKILAMSS